MECCHQQFRWYGKDYLKGQCHEIICFWFFSWISFPPTPEYSIKTVFIFSKILLRYSQVKVLWHNDTGGKFSAANLSLVSTTPVANCHLYQRHRQQICHRCRLHLWQKNGNNYQTADNLKWTWKNHLSIRQLYYPKVSKRNHKKFSDWRFFQLPSTTTPLVNLELRISPRISEKNWNGPICLIRGLVKTDSWKKPEAKNLVSLSL